MEVMLEIYRTLKVLDMEWKEKKNLGGLGGVRTRRGSVSIQRAREYDGNGYVDLKAASSIYFVETRARIQDVVVGFILCKILPIASLLFIGINEPPTLHGRFHQLSCRFPTQEIVSRVYRPWSWQIRYGGEGSQPRR